MDLGTTGYSLDRPKGQQLKRPIWRAAYALTGLTRTLAGRRRTAAALLDLAWITRRLAFEESHRLLGESFSNGGLALSDQWLANNTHPSDRVLDVGCGTGRVAARLAPYVGEVVGVDFDQESLKVARSRRIPNARFVQIDVERGFGDLGHFDSAVLSHVLEHVETPVALLRALTSQVKSLLIEVPDVESDVLNFPRFLLGRPFYTDSDHAREYSRETLTKQLAEAGWTLRHLEATSGSILAVAELGGQAT